MIQSDIPYLAGMEYLAFMKRLLIAIVAFSVVATITACGDCSRKIDCPGFADDTLTALFPYTNNQRLVFRSDTASQAVYNLNNTRTSEPYQANGGFSGPLRCTEEKIFESVEKDSVGRSQFAVELLSGDSRIVYVTIRGTSITFSNYADTAFSTIFLNAQFAPSAYRQNLTLGNRSFTNVVTAVRDTVTIKRNGIYRLFYTRTEGIIGYTDYPSGINWVKQ